MKYFLLFLLTPLFLSGYLYAQGTNVNSFDPTDASKAFFLAMKSNHDTLFFDLKNSPYILKPMRFEKIQQKTIILEKGVEFKAMKGAFPRVGHALIKFLNCERISILGNGATFSMNKEEYNDGEWRHVISIAGSEKITLKDLILCNSGGDGIFIGNFENKLFSQNIDIDNIQSINNKRQGISIVSAKNVLVKNSLFAETKGTLPGAGVDIEPDGPNDIVENIVFTNCVFKNNYNSGIKIALVRLDDTSKPVSIRFENCLLKNNFCLEEVKVPTEIMIKSHPLKPVRGSVVFKNCHVEDSQWGFLYAKLNAEGFDVDFKDCSAKNICKAGKLPAIFLETPDYKENTNLGGFNFHSLSLDYKADVPALKVRGSRRGVMKHMQDVKGKLVLSSKKTKAINYVAYDQKNNKNVNLKIIYRE